MYTFPTCILPHLKTPCFSTGYGLSYKYSPGFIVHHHDGQQKYRAHGNIPLHLRRELSKSYRICVCVCVARMLLHNLEWRHELKINLSQVLVIKTCPSKIV